MIKELEDYSWFPAALRRWQLDFVGAVSVWTKLYRPAVTILNEMIVSNKIIAVEDTCSGSGAPAIDVHRQLSANIPMILTDKFPGTVFENKPGVSYSSNPVDILSMQPVPNTVYTMYNAFHHFSPVQQQSFVKRMAENKTAFLIAEILTPGFLNLVKIILTTTLIQLLTAPFVKPFSLPRLFFTYIIPVNLFTVTYDGIISVVRSRTAAQYSKILEEIKIDAYSITVNTIHNWKGNLVYIKGEPA